MSITGSSLRRLAKFVKRPEVSFLISVAAFAGSAWTYISTVLPRPRVAAVFNDVEPRLDPGRYNGVSWTEIITAVDFINSGNRDVVVHRITFDLYTGDDQQPRERLYVFSHGTRTPAIILKPADIYADDLRATFRTPRSNLDGAVIRLTVASVDSTGREYLFSEPVIRLSKRPKSEQANETEVRDPEFNASLLHRFVPNILTNQ